MSVCFYTVVVAVLPLFNSGREWLYSMPCVPLLFNPGRELLYNLIPGASCVRCSDVVNSGRES